MNRMDGDLQLTGNLRAKSITIPAASGFYVPVANMQHRIVQTYRQAGGADVVAASSYIYTAAAGGKLSSVDVFVDTSPTGTGGKSFAIDVKKSSGAGAFATVLTSVVTVDSTVAARSVIAAAIASAAYSGGDTFKVDVTVSGSTGTQAQGVLVTATFDEDAA